MSSSDHLELHLLSGFQVKFPTESSFFICACVVFPGEGQLYNIEAVIFCYNLYHIIILKC